MTVRRRKTLLLLAAVLAASALVGVLAFGLGVPVKVKQPPASDSLRNTTITPATTQGVAAEDGPAISLQRLRRIASLDLRRPLFAPEKPEPTTAASNPTPRVTPLSLELLGTVDEPGHSYAILSYPGSPWELRGPGESLDTPAGTVTILEVTPRRVIVEHRGKRLERTMPDPEVQRP